MNDRDEGETANPWWSTLDTAAMLCRFVIPFGMDGVPGSPDPAAIDRAIVTKLEYLEKAIAEVPAEIRERHIEMDWHRLATLRATLTVEGRIDRTRIPVDFLAEATESLQQIANKYWPPTPVTTFDRERFGAALTAERFRLTMLGLHETHSAIGQAAFTFGHDVDGCVVADVQTEDWVPNEPAWHPPPAMALPFSIALALRDRSSVGVMPLVAGLALARGLESLGARTDIRWPNDLFLAGRRVAQTRAQGYEGEYGDRMVIAIGVHVTQTPDDFPPRLLSSTTSLAMEGVVTSREDIAAAFLNQLDPLWTEFEKGDPRRLLAAWKTRATFWGRRVRVRNEGGVVEGIARDLDAEGGLVLQVGGERMTLTEGEAELV